MYQENLSHNQEFLEFMIISFILRTLIFASGMIWLGEITCLSLPWVKSLIWHEIISWSWIHSLLKIGVWITNSKCFPYGFCVLCMQNSASLKVFFCLFFFCRGCCKTVFHKGYVFPQLVLCIHRFVYLSFCYSHKIMH